MKNSHNIYLISDSTGETLDRIFLALKAQFENFDYQINQFSFTRTETQIKKIIENAEKNKNSIILYTIVNSKLAKFLSEESIKKKILILASRITLPMNNNLPLIDDSNPHLYTLCQNCKFYNLVTHRTSDFLKN